MEINSSSKPFSSNKMTPAEILKAIFDSYMMGEEMYHRIGIVTAVNLAESTCTVNIANGDTFEDIRLQQLNTELGLIIVPALQKPVLVGWSDKTTGFVAMYSDIQEIVFQNGTFGGLIKISEITSKLNELVAKVNEINTSLKNHTHTSAASGSPTSAPVPAITITDADDFDKDDYENLNFKH